MVDQGGKTYNNPCFSFCTSECSWEICENDPEFSLWRVCLFGSFLVLATGTDVCVEGTINIVGTTETGGTTGSIVCAKSRNRVDSTSHHNTLRHAKTRHAKTRYGTRWLDLSRSVICSLDPLDFKPCWVIDKNRRSRPFLLRDLSAADVFERRHYVYH